MATTTADNIQIIGGVDTHQDLHTAAVVSNDGTVLGAESFSTTRAGYRAMLRWFRSHGELLRVGVESTGTYGAGITRHLALSGTARRRTSGGRGSRSRARWITKRDRSMPLSAAARPIRSHSASVAITARWRRPLASSFMVAIRLKKPASTVTHQTHLGNPYYENRSQENPHDQMTRITYRLRTEPIYLTIKIILMSHPSLHTHIPECNSSMTHNQILCRSNHPHPSLTTTLSHCIITLLQEKPATLRQPQCT